MTLGAGVECLSADRGAELLAEVLNKELGIETNATAILSMFEKRFRRLSDLAHSIHEAQEKQKRSKCEQPAPVAEQYSLQR